MLICMLYTDFIVETVRLLLQNIGSIFQIMEFHIRMFFSMYT